MSAAATVTRHTTVSVRVEKTDRVDSLLTDDPSNTTGQTFYVRGWVATCSCGAKSEGRPTRASADGAQREHRNDAKIAASMGVAL